MATRFYFEYNLTADVTPASWSSGWNKTSGAATSVLTLHKKNTTATEITNALSGTAGHFTAVSRFVSGPLLAQTISGTVSGLLCAAQIAATDNTTLAVAIKVVNSSGTDVGVILAASASDDVSASPPETNTSGYVSRYLRDSAENTSITLSSLAVSDGDRLVIEIGFRQDSTATSSCGITFGSTNAAESGFVTEGTGGTVGGAIEFSGDIRVYDIPTWVGYSSVPGDNGTNAVNPTAVTPPTMRTGDLVVFIGQQRTASASLSISETGGQTWTSENAISTTNQTARLFWCKYNGTWSANPSISFGGTTCNTAVMHVFRASSMGGANYAWAIDVAQVELDIAAAATQTITGQTTLSPATLTLAAWFTADDNTWGSISGAGWTAFNPAQIRNTAGSDQSCTFARQARAYAGSTGNVSMTQLTLGNDAATTFIITFKQTPPAAATTSLLWLPDTYTRHLMVR